jgi:dienelactone hydrolase
MEKYVDFFDYIFGRGNLKPANKLYYDYSFSKWLGLSGEIVDPHDYEVKGIDQLLEDKKGHIIDNSAEWEKKKKDIIGQIKWLMGEAPPAMGKIAFGPKSDYLKDVVGLPRVKKNLGNQIISFGNLYYPLTSDNKTPIKNLPVIIYLHEYSYVKGFATSYRGQNIGDIINRFTDQGYAVYLFDQIGFGNRIEEGRLFYERFPHWSKMGRMIVDVQSAVDELSEIDFLNKNKIYIGGYSLGGTVGLYSAALDDRIAGVISVSGFTPMRLDYPGKSAEGIYCYSHLHGLIPRLGFFAGNENRIPVDFDEILASIAPRPVLVVAPTWDQYGSHIDIKASVSAAAKVYNLYGAREMIQIQSPEDYGRFTSAMKDEVKDWVKDKFK